MKCENCGATLRSEVCDYCGTLSTAYRKESAPVREVNCDTQQPIAPMQQQIVYNTIVNSPEPQVGRRKSKAITFWLAFIPYTGFLGIHRFYTGKIGTGILWLLTCGLFGIGWFIDIILICTGEFRDINGNKLEGNIGSSIVWKILLGLAILSLVSAIIMEIIQNTQNTQNIVGVLLLCVIAGAIVILGGTIIFNGRE